MNTYSLDSLNSEITFTAKLFNVEIKGTFGSFDASLKLERIEQLNEADISVVIDVASINTNEPARDQHLKSADFFHADKYPKISFIKTGLKQHSSSHYSMIGLLTIKYITKVVTFDVHVRESSTSSLHTVLYHCSTVINRHDFGLSYNHTFEKVNGLNNFISIDATFSIQQN